jgi:hypothetical protein
MVDTTSNADIFSLHSFVESKVTENNVPTMVFSYSKEDSVILCESYVPSSFSFTSKDWFEYIVSNNIINIIKLDDKFSSLYIDSEYPEKDIDSYKSLSVQYLIKHKLIEEESEDEFVFDEW